MATNNADNFTNPISVNTGGTGLATLTSHAVQVGNGTSALTQVSGSTGAIAIGTSGSDPSFSATPSVTSITFGSGTALSTYTEGTWTPTLAGLTTAGTTTYTSQNGYYINIGNIVNVQGFIVITAATGTGLAAINNLPFTIKNSTQNVPVGTATVSGAGWTWPALTTDLVITGTTNSTILAFNCFGSAVAQSGLSITNAAVTITFSISYMM